MSKRREKRTHTLTKRVLVMRDRVLFVCQPFQWGYKCGVCGRGNLELKIGFHCRVCRGRVFLIETILATGALA